MEIYEYILLALVGVGAGFINVLAGGGSLLTVPAMVLMGIPGAVANGTNRIGIMAQALTAAYTFFRRGYADFKLSLAMSLSLLPGGVIGAFFGAHLGGEWFNRVLALVMLGVMALMALDTSPKRDGDISEKGNRDEMGIAKGKLRRPVATHLALFVLGFYGGFIHIGIGLLLITVLHRIGGLSLVQVNMHKMTIQLPYTVLAIAIFAAQGKMLWIAGLGLAAGNALGGWLGAHITMTKGDRAIRIVFNTVLVVIVLKLLFFT